MTYILIIEMTWKALVLKKKKKEIKKKTAGIILTQNTCDSLAFLTSHVFPSLQESHISSAHSVRLLAI